MSAPSRRYPGWRSCSRGLAGNSREMASQWTPGNQQGFEILCTVHWHKKLIIPSRSCEQPRSFGSWCSQWQSIQTSSVCTTTRSSLAIWQLKLCIFDNKKQQQQQQPVWASRSGNWKSRQRSLSKIWPDRAIHQRHRSNSCNGFFVLKTWDFQWSWEPSTPRSPPSLRAPLGWEDKIQTSLS